MKPRASAFTLIELLVVITIIVVLLALLAPALDRAVYQAQLAKCGAQLRATGAGVIQYAFDYKRRYPHRGLPDDPTANGIPVHQLARPAEGDQAAGGYDLRPPLRPYLPINKMLNDPLCEPVDLDKSDATGGSAATTHVYAAYYLWFGWRYTHANGGPGMYKLGERWTWNRREFSLLLNDMDVHQAETGYSSHPDNLLFSNVPVQDGVFPFGGLFTASYWSGAPGLNRGLLDLNYVYADGSAQRHAAIEYTDERMTRVPHFNTAHGSGGAANVPRQQ